MSEREDRLKKRRATFKGQIIAMFSRPKVAVKPTAKNGKDEDFRILQVIAASDVPLWPLVQEVCEDPSFDPPQHDDFDALLAAVSQAAAPHLMGKKAPLDAKLNRVLPKGVRRP